MNNFFEHENQSWPPALADNDEMRVCTGKSDLLKPLESLVPHPNDHNNFNKSEADTLIIDGAGLVHRLDPHKFNKPVKTMKDYARHIFLPHVEKELKEVERVDVVWDRYMSDSLKSATRSHRGSGTPLRITATTRIPVNWKSFLRVDSNKSALFHFLASEITTIMVPEGKVLLTTKDDLVIAVPVSTDVTSLMPCNHEEADYRMMLHAADSHQKGLRKIVIEATDTDVVILAIATASKYDMKIWIAFGNSTNFRYISAHDIAHQLGSPRSAALPFLHAVTGCDTVSCLHGIGKKTAWDVFNSMRSVIPVFAELSTAQEDVTEFQMAEIE